MVTVLAVAATVIMGCAHKPSVRPVEIVFACADANLYATGLRSSHWGSRDAEATGIGHENDCSPNCAAGHVHRYALRVLLSSSVVCTRGRREFSRLSWIYTGAGPPSVRRSDGEVLTCSFLTLKP